MFALQHISAVFVADQFYPLMVMLLNYQVLWQTGGKEAGFSRFGIIVVVAHMIWL